LSFHKVVAHSLVFPGKHTDRCTDKDEVGGSSPPRPTKPIASKFAVILTFLFSSESPFKSHFAKNLPKIRQSDADTSAINDIALVGDGSAVVSSKNRIRLAPVEERRPE
jgi:hypothetical protein